MSDRRKLPDGWQVVFLRDVIEDAQSGFASGEREPNGAIQLRMNNVGTRGNLVWDEYIRVPTTQEQLAKYQLQEGDVVFNNTNSTELVGKSALFKDFSEPVVYSNHFTRLRARRNLLDPAYLASWLMRQWQTKLFERICNRWIGQSAVKPSVLLELEIPLPPLPEQRRIVAVLEEKLAAVEQARQAARAQLDAARALPAAYLRAVFEGEEARGWPVRPLGDVLLQRREVIHPRNNPRGETTFVGLEHVESGTGNRIGSLPVRMEELTGRKPKFYQNDIVYGYLRPYLNKVWVAEFEGLCSVDQYVYSVNNELASVGFVAWFMRSPTFLNRAPIDTTPGQLPRIRIEEVAAVDLNLPPLDVQQQIMERLLRQMETVKQLTDGLESQLTELEAIPAAYLQQAFSGVL